MKLSVIIPAHNEEAVIWDCIENCLNKDMKPFEIIVVNDGSINGTLKIMQAYEAQGKIRIVNLAKGHSAAFSRNRGAEMATGDILLFIDADMMITTDNYVERILKAFENPKVVGGQLEGTAEYKTFLQKCQHVRTALTVNKMGRRGVIYLNVIRKEVFEKIGGYDEGIFYYEDREIVRKAREYGEIVELPVNAMHKEPSSMGDFLRQAKYVGKGRKSYQKNMAFNVFMPWDLPTAYRLTGELLPAIVYIFILQPIRLLTILWQVIR
jgi:glycosyltransferase involved in cell wall biosynthesis